MSNLWSSRPGKETWLPVLNCSQGCYCAGRVSGVSLARRSRRAHPSSQRPFFSLSFFLAATTHDVSLPSLFFSFLSLLFQALFDLEATNNELKTDLRDLYINSAQEVDVNGGRTAIVIHVSTHIEACKVPLPALAHLFPTGGKGFF